MDSIKVNELLGKALVSITFLQRQIEGLGRQAAFVVQKAFDKPPALMRARHE